VLAPIVESTLAHLALDRAAVPLAALEHHIAGAQPVRSLAAALARPGLQLIAEFKPRSPSKGWLRRDAQPADFVDAYRPAAALSVLCDRDHFGGGVHLLQAFRPLTDQPLLAKGFFVEDYQLAQVRAAGADAALLIARLLPGPLLSAMLDGCRRRGLEALVEVHNPGELDRAVAAGARIIGVNARDLDTLEIDLVACRDLVASVPPGHLRVAESGVEHPDEVALLRALAAKDGVDAVLIGSAFMGAVDPAAAVAALGFR
jgi:indole-3-glycerol phosphate synthase